MKPKILLTRKAKKDILEIARYTDAVWGRKQRNRYLEEIDQQLLKLVDNPQLGQDCGFINEGYRKCLVRKHFIYYRIRNDDYLIVVRLIHERMDCDSMFGKSEGQD